MYLPPAEGGRFAQVDYWGNAPRPWVVTLPFAAIPSERWIVVFQIGVSLLSWTALLVAVTHLPFRHAVPRWSALIVVACVGLSATATSWDPLLQSDSLAMSGAVLVVASAVACVGRRPSWWALAGAAVGALLVGLIRPVGLLPVLVLGGWLVLRLVRRKPSATDADATRGSTVAMPLVMAGLLALITGYSSVVNAHMDLAWGSDLAGQPDLQGRTMQQVGVVALTPWGSGLVIRLAEDGGFRCMAEQYRTGTDPNGWRGDLVTHCPREAADFAHDFQGRYLRWLATHPRATARVLVAPFTEAFTSTGATDQLDLVPGPVSELWQPATPTGRNPTMLWLFLLAAAMVLLTPSGPHRSAVVLMLGIAVASALAVGLTVAFSPLDAARVGSSPAMLTRLATLIGLAIAADALLTRRHLLRK